jgi:dipeptidyl aminopeptidase/acylaminoacyl peptidase
VSIGGAPRAILRDVQDADWTPDGSALAIIREVNGHSRLEYPIGHVLYEASGYVSDVRFSPRGGQIAFFEHPFRYDDRGSIAVLDLQGHKRLLAQGYAAEEGLAWARDGSAVYFSSVGSGESHFVIHAATLAGQLRTVLGGAEDISVLDTGKKGNLLAKEDADQYRLLVRAPGAKVERDLSWLDQSRLPWFSSDGQEVLFTDENNISAGANYALLLRKTDGSPVVRLGDGLAAGFSPDGLWALSIIPGPPAQLVLYPTGAGEKRILEPGHMQNYESAEFFPDGKRVLACGNETGHSTRCYVQGLEGGEPRPITPEGTRSGVVSPDGRLVLAQGVDGKYSLYPVAGGSPQPAPGMNPEDVVIRWKEDGRSVWVFHTTEIPARIEEVALSTGRRTLVREVAPTDRAGVLSIMDVAMAGRGMPYAYSYERDLSTLTVIEEVR